MKLSTRTLSILKNFTEINPCLLIREGNVQRTISADQTLLAEANLEDPFPQDFGIYTLPEFLGNLTILENPELEFNKEAVHIKSGNLSLKYYGCNPSLITSPPNKQLDVSNATAEFLLPSEAMQLMLKLSNLNSFPYVTITGSGGYISLQAHKDDDTTNVAEMSQLAPYEGPEFSARLKTDLLVMIPDHYNVKVINSSFVFFINQSENLRYFVAQEAVK